MLVNEEGDAVVSTFDRLVRIATLHRLSLVVNTLRAKRSLKLSNKIFGGCTNGVISATCVYTVQTASVHKRHSAGLYPRQQTVEK